MAEPIHIGHLIQEELRVQGRSVAWFARQMNTSHMTCYHLFHSYSTDTQVMLRGSGSRTYKVVSLREQLLTANY